MSDDTEVVIPPVVFSGQAFSDARQKLGLSTEQVAHQLHLHERIIHAIEQGALDKLRDPVFSRGYIRSYARFLKLDADGLVSAYNQQTGNLATTAEVKAIGTVSTVPGRGQGHPVLKVGTWLFVLALVAASVWWWQAQFGFDVDERRAQDDLPVSVETTDGTTLVLPQLDEIEADMDSAAGVLEQTVSEAITGSDTAAGMAEAPAVEGSQASTEASAEPEALPAAEEGEQASETLAQAAALFPGLALSFADDCWLSVKDARGRTLYSGVAKGGSSLELEGEEPLAVVIGRVSAVAEIRYDNKPIELASISKENVARLRLPL
ncbi:DUF4115 domain-containing protein [Marinobacterium maritimum]|uniref:DUF4115 domain-containing protein n=1 Tax=Marinobacterium maritimum TaxID=500162 RepID=A0ABN1I733_9GAMM